MQDRCMALVGADGKALTGEYLKAAEEAILSAKNAGLKIWINRNGYFYQRENSIFAISEALIDKTGTKVRMCSAPLHGNSAVCESCGGVCTDHLRQCECGKLIGAEMGVCPHCGRKQVERKKYNFSDGFWTKPADVFAEYFSCKDVGMLLKDGLNVRENESCIVLSNGALDGIFPAGKHDLTEKASCDLIMVEKAEISQPVSIRNVETSDAVTVDFKAEILFRIDLDGCVRFTQELMGNSLYLLDKNLSNSLCYDEILQRVLPDFEEVVKDSCRKISAKELYSDAEARIRIVKEIRETIAACFESLGLRYIRLKNMDFSSEAFELLKSRHVELETKRNELEFMLELEEISNQEIKQQKLSEKEMQDFVAQLAHEKGISEELRRQELERIRNDWQRQKEVEKAEHENLLKTIDDQAEHARELEQIEHEQQAEDTKHAHELERRRKEYEAMLENAKIQGQIAAIELKIKRDKDQAEKETLETYIKIRERKNALPKYLPDNDVCVTQTIQQVSDVQKREALQEIEKMVRRSAKYPEIFLAAAAARGDQRAISELNRLAVKQVNDIDKLKAENIDLYDQLCKISVNRFNFMKDLLLDDLRTGNSFSKLDLVGIFSESQEMEKVSDQVRPVSECPHLDVEYNRNLFLLRNASAVLNLRLTPKIKHLDLAIFLVKERNGIRSRREIEILKVFEKGKQTRLDIQLSPGNVYGNLMITLYFVVRVNGEALYYSTCISSAVYDSQQTSANLNLTISNTVNASGAADVSYRSDVSSLLEELKKNNASVNDMIARLNSLSPNYETLALEETRWRPEDYMIHGSRFKGNKLRLKWKDHSLVLLGMKSMKLGRNRKIVDLAVRTPDEYQNRTVSKHHVTICSEQNSVYLFDESSSGTWINGKKLPNKEREELTLEDCEVQFGDVRWNMHMQLCEPSCKNVCQNCEQNKAKCLTFDRKDGVKEQYLMVCQCCDLGRVLPALENWDIFFRDDSFFIRDPHGDFFHLSPGSPVEASGQKIDVMMYEV